MIGGPSVAKSYGKKKGGGGRRAGRYRENSNSFEKFIADLIIVGLIILAIWIGYNNPQKKPSTAAAANPYTAEDTV